MLILGASGNLGPHVIKAVEGEHTLRLADVARPEETTHENLATDVSNAKHVMAAAEGMDAIINLSVLRRDRQLAFDVNARGCYNMMAAAERHGIRRVINTGPVHTVAGPTYYEFDYDLDANVPPQPGTYIYAFTKSLGLEICRAFTENHDLYVMTFLYTTFTDHDDHAADGQDIFPFAVTWRDAAEAFRHALSVDLKQLPSRCEVFNILADLPHQRFSNERAKRVLGWRPQDRLEQFWNRR